MDVWSGWLGALQPLLIYLASEILIPLHRKKRGRRRRRVVNHFDSSSFSLSSTKFRSRPTSPRSWGWCRGKKNSCLCRGFSCVLRKCALLRHGRAQRGSSAGVRPPPSALYVRVVPPTDPIAGDCPGVPGGWLALDRRTGGDVWNEPGI